MATKHEALPPKVLFLKKVADHIAATAGVECRKDADVIDETPMAYKSIDAVMEAEGSCRHRSHSAAGGLCKRLKQSPRESEERVMRTRGPHHASCQRGPPSRVQPALRRRQFM